MNNRMSLHSPPEERASQLKLQMFLVDLTSKSVANARESGRTKSLSLRAVDRPPLLMVLPAYSPLLLVKTEGVCVWYLLGGWAEG